MSERMTGIVDLISALAWPSVVGGGLWYYRNDIKTALKRVTEVGPTGAKFGLPEQQIPSSPSTVAAQELPVPKPDAVAPKPDLRTFIEQIKSFISPDQLEPVLQGLRTELPAIVGTNPSDQVEALTYLAASLSVQLSHERNYNFIFGSQLHLLGRANVAPVAPEVANSIYEQAKAANPVYGTYTFDQWIGFLIQSGLLTHDAGGYAITNLGRGFLKYLVDMRKPLFKGL
jgi:hypothetical protein